LPYNGVVGGAELGDGACLAVVEDFLNTLDRRSFVHDGTLHGGGDDLTSPAALAQWLRRHALVTRTSKVTSADLDIARDLRSALRGALGEEDDRGAKSDSRAPKRRDSRALACQLPLVLDLKAEQGPHLSPGVPGTRGALATMLVAVAAAQVDGTWARLRLCASPECRWAFRDTSRGGARRWCSMSVCGNRHKTRSYRSAS
jgi:predicted RNA-binding Zn ribbon-like protein